jgi:hypothetical protein
MVVAVWGWLWPVGFGGKMLVGGDATEFSMGLMAFLRESLRAGRLPLWNDLWGFGFPGLAESQMGVFYPPHLLYLAFPTELAYTVSMVLHTTWAALGACWAARRFGASEPAAALAGFAFATCGFFLIHQPHQWGYTVGSWMPWAWGLAWLVARGQGTPRTPWILAAVLAIQTLPGHFQLAFITELGVLILALAAGRWRGLMGVILALLGMLPLAAIQLWPTFRLAALAAGQRDFGYLSGFASAPIHLVSLVAPGLFHRSPLWRPVAWDLFHTAPEELLDHIGLAPLFLAISSLVMGIRREPGTRALAIVLVAAVFLSLGPYAPGFEALIRLPGFSFFRAPGRWGLATSLALTLLAARGFDRLASWNHARIGLGGFVLGALLAIGLVVGGFELALASSRGEGLPAALFDARFRALPWSTRGDSYTLARLALEARQPRDDLRTVSALARLGLWTPGRVPTSLERERFAIYRLELSGTGVILVALLLLAVLGKRPRTFAIGLTLITLGEAGLQARARPFDFGPVSALTTQSRVLGKLRDLPRGTRSLDPTRNMGMVAGVAPVSSYRTLDLPSPTGLLALARGPGQAPGTAEALRLAGVGVRVLDPGEIRDLAGRTPPGWKPDASPVSDPALAGWLFGEDLARLQGARDFGLLVAPGTPTQAWLVPTQGRGLEKLDAMRDPRVLLAALKGASALPWKSISPEVSEVDVKILAPGPGMVVLSRTFDPEWRAWWSNESGTRPAEVVSVLGGWQGVVAPEPGRWTLRLEYAGRAARLGITISSLAWSVWGLGYWRAGGKRAATNPGAST